RESRAKNGMDSGMTITPHPFGRASRAATTTIAIMRLLIVNRPRGHRMSRLPQSSPATLTSTSPVPAPVLADHTPPDAFTETVGPPAADVRPWFVAEYVLTFPQGSGDARSSRLAVRRTGPCHRGRGTSAGSPGRRPRTEPDL